MEHRFDFRTKLAKILIIVTSVAAIASCFTMLIYADRKTIIVDEEESAQEEYVEEVFADKLWTVDVASLKSTGKSVIEFYLPGGTEKGDAFAYFKYDTNTLEAVIGGTKENYFLSNSPTGDFSLVTSEKGSFHEGVTTVSINFSEPVYCDSSYINGKLSVSFVPVKDSEEKVVFIDPGHGGSSNGTRAGDVAEKDIVLQIARETEKLSKDKPYRVVLSRYADYSVATKDRIKAVSNSGADFYVGLHLSSNVDDVKEFGMKTVYNDSYFRNGIENAAFADLVLKNAVTSTSNLALGIFPAGNEDGILKVIDIPATVLYAGYISNDSEAQLLNRPQYDTEIAQGIIDALDGVIER